MSGTRATTWFWTSMRAFWSQDDGSYSGSTTAEITRCSRLFRPRHVLGLDPLDFISSVMARSSLLVSTLAPNHYYMINATQGNTEHTQNTYREHIQTTLTRSHIAENPQLTLENTQSRNLS